MLTGTWLEREKLLAGLFFLLLLLLLLLPPELTVLPPDTFLFRRLFGACLAGSATKSQSGQWKRYNRVVSPSLDPQTAGFVFTWRRYHSLPLLEEAGLQAVSGAQTVRLMSGHQLLHGLQYHTKLRGR